ncbi:purine nucleosidase [Thermocatellispora tengchongensis]|uniref:Purine nucleosidase n=1 Tax=Thermocatellispora tengchongensis TaxID=1073253 RepID=A0A840PQJ1_9ACTN|nr:nucleoside hydrolase [Thermocatellispora tengchongensis]MBB5140030.1 purine nucleosidase [Thermocatellispora tengchongensis]
MTSSTASSTAPRRVVLDTDLGSDVDDVLALAVLLGSPEVDLLGCTTVYGDTALRARLTKRFLRLAGREAPVVPGERETLTGRKVWWAGHEGALFADLDTEPLDDGADAPAYLTAQVAAAPGEIDVVAIGPLTNIARAVQADPGFAGNVRHLWIMGGRFGGAGDPEHNFRSDPEAAAIVFGSGAPITVTGLEVTTTVRLDAADVGRISAAGALGAALEAEIRQWWRFWNTEWNTPHDPITVLTMLVPEMFAFTAYGSVGVTPDGPDAGASAFTAGEGATRVTTGAGPREVAEEIVRRIVTAGS